MTGFEAVKTSRNNAVSTDITGKDTVNSIDPADVGNNIVENLNALTPFMNAINAFTFYTGTPDPNTLGVGVENDIYEQTNGGVSIVKWRKTTADWVVQSTMPLGISYQNGIVTGLRAQINTVALAVEVSSGSWAINNVIYSKAIPTYLNYGAPEVGINRIDTIYADTNGDILIISGSPNATPVKPTLPPNTIEVDSVYVPAEGTGNAYLFSGGSSTDGGTIQEPNGIVTAGAITFDDLTYLATFTSPFTYRINGNVFTPTQTTLQMNAPDGTYTRIDVIYGKTDATYGFVEGVAAYTYSAPDIPPNTLALALIYRFAGGTNQVVILDTSGYYPKTGGNIDGDVNITNGFNLNLDASEDSEDSGDIVFRKNVAGTKSEMIRLFSGFDGDNNLFIRFDGYPNPQYKVLHSGNVKLVFTNSDLDDTTYPGMIVLPVSLSETETFFGQIRVNYYDTDDTTLLSYEFITPSYDAAVGVLTGFTSKVDHMRIFVPII